MAMAMVLPLALEKYPTATSSGAAATETTITKGGGNV